MSILNNAYTAKKYYEYDSYGKAEEKGATDFINENTFTGAIAEGDGIYYMNARFYDANTGRFLSQDTYKGNAYEPWTQNLYSYVGNNPVNYIDPTGHIPVPLITGLIGAAIGAGVVLIKDALDGGGLDTDWKVYAGAAAAGFIVGATGNAAAIASKAITLGTGMFVMGTAGLTASAANQAISEGEINYGEAAIDGVNTAFMFGIFQVLSQALSDYLNQACFVEGTKITTKDGYKNIEDIEAGDYALSENPETGEQEYKRVLQTFINETYTIISININSEIIETTPEHPFWIEEKGWIEAEKLSSGDLVRLSNGDTAVVCSVKIIKLDKAIEVYNFEVEDFHTYYVTESSVLVHNRCQIKPQGNPKRVDDSYLKKQGIDPHQFKKEILGGGKNSRFDIYVDTKSGEIWLQSKDGIWSETGSKMSHFKD